MRPGWVKPCECGKAERGAYCPECRAFGDGYNGGTWERPSLSPAVSDSAETVEDETAAVECPFCPEPLDSHSICEPEPWCPGHRASARIVGNAAYCNECDGRLRPAASSNYSHGTGH